MDVRQGICNTWRRTSSAPIGVRTCNSGSPVTPVQRRTRLTSRRQAAQPCSPASHALALDHLTLTAADANALGQDVEACQGPSLECGPAVLQTRLSKAHTSAVSAALVVQDTLDEKLVATASLDKGMAIWRFYATQGEAENGEGSCNESIEVTRLKVPGAPVFSLAKIPDVLPDGTIVRKRQKPSGIYLGTASKEVLAWMLGSKDVTDKVVLDGHTGWVRSLSVTGKWLFSCGCNFLRQWDTTYRTPKEVNSVKLFTGDILAIETSNGRVFTAGADGSLRSWTITRSGALEEGPRVERAHEGRVACCVAAPAGTDRVFTVSYDGCVKAWAASTLELVAEAKGAHRGEKIFCAAVGPNDVLFTGGDDKLIRAWDLDLNPVGPPLDGHVSSVRVLAAGRRGLLISGDAEGDVCIWETYDVKPPSPVPTTAAAASSVAAAEAAMPGASNITEADLEAALGRGQAAAVAAAEDFMAATAAAEAGGVEVSIGQAALQQLETMLAAPAAGAPGQEDPHAHHQQLEPEQQPQQQQLGAAAVLPASDGPCDLGTPPQQQALQELAVGVLAHPHDAFQGLPGIVETGGVESPDPWQQQSPQLAVDDGHGTAVGDWAGTPAAAATYADAEVGDMAAVAVAADAAAAPVSHPLDLEREEAWAAGQEPAAPENDSPEPWTEASTQADADAAAVWTAQQPLAQPSEGLSGVGAWDDGTGADAAAAAPGMSWGTDAPAGFEVDGRNVAAGAALGGGWVDDSSLPHGHAAIVANGEYADASLVAPVQQLAVAARTDPRLGTVPDETAPVSHVPNGAEDASLHHAAAGPVGLEPHVVTAEAGPTSWLHHDSYELEAGVPTAAQNHLFGSNGSNGHGAEAALPEAAAVDARSHHPGNVLLTDHVAAIEEPLPPTGYESPAAEAASAPPQRPPSPVTRHIEVENVAAAVAASCLNKEVMASSMVGAEGR